MAADTKLKNSKNVTRSAGETMAVARALSREFKGGEVVYLIGELGAGKTVFAKGLAAGLGLKSVHQVCSPTFTLMNVYPTRVPIYHFDLYRLAGAPEITELGFEDYVGEGVVVVEWAEKIPFTIPAIQVTIEVLDNQRRRIEINPPIRPFSKEGGRGDDSIVSNKKKRGRHEDRTTEKSDR
jgi:tRNA threonylcarbamoyladenosine biosynthesis protein TsaE